MILSASTLKMSWAATLHIENRSRGILWMLATMVCFITLDAIVKLGLERYSLIQITWGRFFFATVFAAIWCGTALPSLAVSKVPWQQTIRSFFLMVTTGFFNGGVMFVPLATATTIMFMTPVITTVLSVIVLGEYVGMRRWASVAVGFVGAIIVVQPWAAFANGVNPGALLLLAAAVSNASYQIATRKVRIDDPRTSLLFTAAFGAVVTSIVLPWHWQMPDFYGWLLMASSGLAGMLGHLCIIQAFRNAPASVISPFSYSSLIWATLFGFVIWGDFPSSNVWLGATLIIASGLYIFWRERKLQSLP
jgi:drug/metabolite transporter (DMT)-like permease